MIFAVIQQAPGGAPRIVACDIDDVRSALDLAGQHREILYARGEDRCEVDVVEQVCADAVSRGEPPEGTGLFEIFEPKSRRYITVLKVSGASLTGILR